MRYRDISSLVAIVANVSGARVLQRNQSGNGYTVDMDSDSIERLETQIAFLESANLELSEVVYRQQQEIRDLRARVDALAQQFAAAQVPTTARTPEEERPPHY